MNTTISHFISTYRIAKALHHHFPAFTLVLSFYKKQFFCKINSVKAMGFLGNKVESKVKRYYASTENKMGLIVNREEDLIARMERLLDTAYNEIFYVRNYQKVREFMDLKNNNSVSFNLITNLEVGTVISEQIAHMKNAISAKFMPNADNLASVTMVKTPAFMSPPGFGKTAIIRSFLESAKSSGAIKDYVFYDMSRHDPVTAPIGLSLLTEVTSGERDDHVGNLAVVDTGRNFIDLNPLAFMLYYLEALENSEMYKEDKEAILNQLTEKIQTFFTTLSSQTTVDSINFVNRIKVELGNILQNKKSNSTTLAVFTVYGALSSVALKVFAPLFSLIVGYRIDGDGEFSGRDDLNATLNELYRMAFYILHEVSIKAASYFVSYHYALKNEAQDDGAFMDSFIFNFLMSLLQNVYSSLSDLASKEEDLVDFKRKIWPNFLSNIGIIDYLTERNKQYVASKDFDFKVPVEKVVEFHKLSATAEGERYLSAIRDVLNNYLVELRKILGFADIDHVLINEIKGTIILPEKSSSNSDAEYYSKQDRAKRGIEDMFYDAFKEDYLKKQGKDDDLYFSLPETYHQVPSLDKLANMIRLRNKKEQALFWGLKEAHERLLAILPPDKPQDLNAVKFYKKGEEVISVNLNSLADAYAGTIEGLLDASAKHMARFIKENSLKGIEDREALDKSKGIISALFKYWIAPYLDSDQIRVQKIQEASEKQINDIVSKLLQGEGFGSKKMLEVVFPKEVESILKQARRDYRALQKRKKNVAPSEIPIYVIYLDEFFTQLKKDNFAVVLKLWDGLGNRLDKFPENVLLVLAGNSPSEQTWDSLKSIFSEGGDSSDLEGIADTLAAFLARIRLFLLTPDYSFGVKTALKSILGIKRLEDTDAIKDAYYGLEVKKELNRIVSSQIKSEGAKKLINIILQSKEYLSPLSPKESKILEAMNIIKQFVESHPETRSLFKDLQAQLEKSSRLAVEIRFWMAVVLAAFYIGINSYFSIALEYFMNKLNREEEKLYIGKEEVEYLQKLIQEVIKEWSVTSSEHEIFKNDFANDTILVIYYITAAILVGVIKDALDELGMNNEPEDIMNIFGVNSAEIKVKDKLCLLCEKTEKSGEITASLPSFNTPKNESGSIFLIDLSNSVVVYSGSIKISVSVCSYKDSSGPARRGYYVSLSDERYREPINFLYLMLVAMAVNMAGSNIDAQYDNDKNKRLIMGSLGMFLHKIYSEFANTSVREQTIQFYAQKTALQQYYKALGFVVTYLEAIRLFVETGMYEKIDPNSKVYEAARTIIGEFGNQLQDIKEEIRKGNISQDITDAYKELFGGAFIARKHEQLKLGNVLMSSKEATAEKLNQRNEGEILLRKTASFDLGISKSIYGIVARVLSRFGQLEKNLYIEDENLIWKVAAGLYLDGVKVSLFEHLVGSSYVGSIVNLITAQSITGTSTNSNSGGSDIFNPKAAKVYPYIWYLPFVKKNEKIKQDESSLESLLIEMIDGAISESATGGKFIQAKERLKRVLENLPKVKEQKPFFYYDLLDNKESIKEVLPWPQEVSGLYEEIMSSSEQKLEKQLSKYRNREDYFSELYTNLYTFVTTVLNLKIEQQATDEDLKKREEKLLQYIEENFQDEIADNKGEEINFVKRFYISLKFYRGILNALERFNSKEIKEEELANEFKKIAQDTAREISGTEDRSITAGVEERLTSIANLLRFRIRKSFISLVFKDNLFEQELRKYIAVLLDAFDVIRIISSGKQNEKIKEKMKSYFQKIMESHESSSNEDNEALKKIITPSDSTATIANNEEQSTSTGRQNILKEKIEFHRGKEVVERMEEGKLSVNSAKIFFPTSFYVQGNGKIVIIQDKMPVCTDDNFNNSRRKTNTVLKSYEVDHAYAIKEIKSLVDLAVVPSNPFINTFFYIKDGTEVASLYQLAHWDSVLRLNTPDAKSQRAMLLIGIMTLMNYFEKYLPEDKKLDPSNVMNILNKMIDDGDMHPILLAAILSLSGPDNEQIINNIKQKVLEQKFYKPYANYRNNTEGTTQTTTTYSVGEKEVKTEASKEIDVKKYLVNTLWIVPIGINLDALFIGRYQLDKNNGENFENFMIEINAPESSTETGVLETETTGTDFPEVNEPKVNEPKKSGEGRRGRPRKYPRP